MKKEYLSAILCAALFVISCSTSNKTDKTASSSDEVYELNAPESSTELSEHSVQYEAPPSAADKESLKSKEELLSGEHKDYATTTVEEDIIRRENNQQVKANLLTATEVNDFKKWDEWEELLNKDFYTYKNRWKFIPQQRFVARVSDKNQRPVVDAAVRLFDSKGNLAWSARTDNTGTAQLWSNVFLSPNNQDKKYTAPYKIVFTYGQEEKTIQNAQPYPQETNVVQMNTSSRPKSDVDIFFIIDATGSMSDELNYLQAELYNIIGKVKSGQSNLNIRMGSLVYRDLEDEYVTRKTSLSSNISQTVDFLKKQYADGGGDTPEAVEEALYEATEKESWKSSALSRIAFLVLDAPPHNNPQSIRRIQQQIAMAAIKGIRIIPLVASGMGQDGEYLMRCFALTTNGTYVTLTDDSGIGNPHAKPTTDYYRVEKLNDLIIRIISEYTRIPQISK